MSTAGIYKIINTSNNKFYIGSSRDIAGRWRVHKSRLRLNKHHSPHLQKSYNLNSNYFVYEIIEEISNVALLEEREQFWVDHYESIAQASKALGVSVVKIRDNANKKRKSRAPTFEWVTDE